MIFYVDKPVDTITAIQQNIQQTQQTAEQLKKDQEKTSTLVEQLRVQIEQTKIQLEQTKAQKEQAQQLVDNTLESIKYTARQIYINGGPLGDDFSVLITGPTTDTAELTYMWGVHNQNISTGLGAKKEAEEKQVQLEEQQGSLTEQAQNLANLEKQQKQTQKTLDAVVKKLKKNESQLLEYAQMKNQAGLYAQSLVASNQTSTTLTGENGAPLTGPVAGFGNPLDGNLNIVSEYGMRFHPIRRVWSLHTGADFEASSGEPIYAVADGKVVSSGWNDAYGNNLVIQHGMVDGQSVATQYAHATKLLVKAGDDVKAGQKIALVGSTGWSTGPHLHFEVRLDGKPVQPRPWLGL